MRGLENRNRPGGDIIEMLLFNEVISSQGLLEIPLFGKRFTWSNKQQPPLLERIDWFFTSISWTLLYPNTKSTTLVAEVSDHTPCLIEVATDIPKGSIFHFENYWMEHEHFVQIVQYGWSISTFHTDVAKTLTAKFKNLRRVKHI